MFSHLKGRRVAVGVGGGIAAYKACELVRELSRAGAQVRVAMTSAAQKFVTALTFQSLSGQPVLTDDFDVQQSAFGHLDLARWAELFVVSPATADLIARISAGMANDAVTAALLAFRGPVLLAPAMNVAMFENALTQGNLKALLSRPHFRTVGPRSGLLACGDVGVGRLAEPSDIVMAVSQLFSEGPLSGRKVLLTAGPTREFLDPVRFLSNPSTGKMGLALAQVARARGAEVTVVLGPVGDAEQDGLEIVNVVTAEQMAAEVLARVEQVDYVIATAAVSDYRPESFSAQKLKKGQGDENLKLVRTADVLFEVSQKMKSWARRPVLVGFAAETEKLAENARAKLLAKGLDAIIANDISEPGAGFGAETNHVLFMPKEGSPVEFSGSKREVAASIWDALAVQAPRGVGAA